jgi:hypothetical protein
MLNPFRRKPKTDDTRRVELIEALSSLLYIQQVASGGHDIEDTHGTLNRKALGYIYGFVDCALTSSTLNSEDAFVSAPIMMGVLGKLFPGRETRLCDFLAANVGKDKMLMEGVMTGGQQYLDHLVKGNAASPPFGLARFLIEAQQQ